MAGALILIDDKHVPLSRILWVADVPHFCGGEDCTVEGRYEVRIEAGDSLFCTREERDVTIEAIEEWHHRD